MYTIINKRKIWFALSGLLVLGSILVWIALGLNYGIDFTGGSLLEVRYEHVEAPSRQEVVDRLSDLDLNPSVSATDDNGFILRFRDVDEATHQEILNRLSPGGEEGQEGKSDNADEVDTDEAIAEPGSEAEALPALIEERFDSIGPSIGQELKARSLEALIAVLIAIVLYIAYAFRKVSYPVSSWKYGIVAVITLFHDVLITVGIFIVLGHYFGIQVNTAFVAALLTVLGYSVNDTIVVFDRIRENLSRYEGKFSEVVERSVKETVSRSINTSLTTILVLLAIFLFGGETVKDFVLTLIIGIAFGTYSSIFIASPLLVTWHNLSVKLKKGRG